MHRFVEVSHPIEAGMKTYPGLPEPRVEVLWDYDDSRERYQGKAEFFIASLHLCGNTGTYVDSPRHRYRDRADLAAIPLEAVAHLPVTTVDARESPGRALGAELLRGLEITGRAVLIDTGWSRHWRTEQYFSGHPFLTAEASELLASAGARFVGIDSLNIDDTADLARPAHSILLRAGIPVCEHMTNLDQLAPEGGFLHAVPLAWVGGASLPVRAYVIYKGDSPL
jgi:kynurenine formamidase